MNKIYNKLALIMHKRCNAQCSICCFSCTPESHEKLKLKTILSYVDQAKDINDITSVSFTGGEPFLEYRSLVQLIKRATENGLFVSTITNGYWATSYEKAYDRLSELKHYGLKHLNISHDKYHKEYVPTGCVKNILDVALQLGIATTLVMVAKKEDSIGSIVNELGNSLYGTNLNVAACLPVGAAADYSDVHFEQLLDIEGLRCIYGKNMVVGYEGTVFPCCSQVIYETGLGVGNYEDMKLQEALSKLENNALLYLLRNEKMDFFINIAKNELYIELPKKVVNVCELCAKLFTKENIPLFYPYVLKRIAEIKNDKIVS